MRPEDEMRAAIKALPVGTVVRLGHTFPETGNFQGSQYLRTRHGLRYIGPGRDESDAITLHQQVEKCDDFRVDARPTTVLPDPTADTVLLNKVREIVAGVDLDDPDHDVPVSYACADAFDEIAALLAGGDR